jgi:hypothetical protein
MIASITFGTFLFFGSMTVIAFVFAYLGLPETKGVSLENMDELWACKGVARRMREEYDERRILLGQSMGEDEEKAHVEVVEGKD